MQATPAVQARKPTPQRRLPVGAEVQPKGGVHFRVWAPQRTQVDVVVEPSGEVAPLARDEAGYFSGLVAAAEAGTLYRYRLDGAEWFPDPASRFQPQGPHGPSQVVDPTAFAWTDQAWRGLELPGQVLYELPQGKGSRRRAAGPCPLSSRELDVLRRLAEGKVYKQIAHELTLSTSTVRTHLHNIYGKLGAVDRAQAVLIATERGWL